MSQIIDSINLFWFEDLEENSLVIYLDTIEFIKGCLWFSPNVIIKSRRTKFITLIEYIKQYSMFYESKECNETIKLLSQ